MSVIFDVNRENLWMHSKNNNYGLNYVVEDNKAVFNIDEINIISENNSDNRLSYFDVKNIDVTSCNFSDFCKAVDFAKTSCRSYDYSDTFLNSFSDTFDNEKIYNFYEYFDNYRLDCAKRGDMKIYYEVEPILDAARSMMYINKNHLDEYNITDDGYFKDDIFMEGLGFGRYGSYRLGVDSLSIDNEDYTIIAEYDWESTANHPIVAVTIELFATDTKFDGIYVVDIPSIDLSNATAVELFAYYSYKNSLNNDGWENKYNCNSEFSDILASGAFQFESLNDFSEKKYDLISLVNKAKDIVLCNLSGEKGNDNMLDFIKLNYTKDYMERLVKSYDEIIFSINSNK